jgi:opacity protein-like surface antigen
VLETADFTRASPGEFVAGWNAGTSIVQSSRAGLGESLEYRHLLWGSNSAGLLYSRTPTDSELHVPQSALIPQRYVDSWSITRNEFDLLFTHQLKWEARGRISPYGAAGAGGIMLNGGKSESGFDKQFAYVAGGGADIKIPFRIRLRLGMTTDILKASTYGDVTYRSSWTMMAEPRIGFVIPLGMPERD